MEPILYPVLTGDLLCVWRHARRTFSKQTCLCHSCQKMGDAKFYRPDAVDDGTLSTLVIAVVVISWKLTCLHQAF